MIKYYGGKQWLAKNIEMYLPQKEIKQFVDLFCGGGSIADFAVKKFETVIINDKDYALMNFYNFIKKYPTSFIVKYFSSQREQITYEEVKGYRYLLNSTDLEESKMAFMYYTCVYCGWGGKVYQCPTKDNYNKYMNRNIERDVLRCKATLEKCIIKCEDYHNIQVKNSLIYCDPPYAKVADLTYYGAKGESHKNFNHEEFKSYIENQKKDNFVMISYEDSDYIRNLYKDWNLIELNKKVVYYDNKEKRGKSIIANELLILNYK